jgi:hypothetical protein
MPDLTGLPALDMAIGLAFIFLLMSLLATTVQEQIAAVLALRSSTLLRGLRNMLENDADAPSGESADAPSAENQPGPSTDPAGLVESLYRHPLIRSLYKPGRFVPRRKTKNGEDTLWKYGRLPSYIAPRSFALALLDTLAPDAMAPDEAGTPRSSLDVVRAVRTKINEAGLPAGVKRQLITLVDEARGDIDAVRKNLEEWFDDSMARVSGWYKRHTQLILLPIALAITLGLNANALTIGDRLWKDTALRAAIVQQAVKASPETVTPDKAADNVDSVRKLGVPLGWTGDADDPRHVDLAESFKATVTILFGWVFTIGAIMLGAPFWFDTLSRLSRLRNSGKPEAPLPASAFGKPGERVGTTR